MATRASYPRFGREGPPPSVELTSDDAAILRLVYRYRFVRSDDLYRFFPDRSPDRLSRRLTLLYRAHYLDRPEAQKNPFRSGGSQPVVYGLDIAGARYLKEQHGAAAGSTNLKSRNRDFKRENLDHTLAISRFMIGLELACRSRTDVSLVHFEEILARASKETREAVEPRSWPVPLRYNGMKATTHLMPDAIFGLRLARQNELPMLTYVFLEVDRGTMTIAPSARARESDGFLHRSSVLKKFIAYAESANRKLHQQHFGIPSARILTLTTSEVRSAAIRKAACEHVVERQSLPTGLLLFGVLIDAMNPLETTFQNSAGQATNLLAL